MRNLLYIRPDNIGDLIMCTPALKAIKEQTNARITLLCSPSVLPLLKFLPFVDDHISCRLPWFPCGDSDPDDTLKLVEEIRMRHFDTAIISSVFSQNSLPSALLAYQASIPERVGYCRENPYQLLTKWIPDDEPYTLIRHQVEREIALVEALGIRVHQSDLAIEFPSADAKRLEERLEQYLKAGEESWLVVHPGVSEKKRQYPIRNWRTLLKELGKEFTGPVFISGTASEQDMAEEICSETEGRVHSLCGQLNFGEYLALIGKAKALISVNTSAIHIAAAYKIPTVVLYAQTNPQHTPWNSPSRVLPFAVDCRLASRNRVLQFVHRQHYNGFSGSHSNLEEISMPAAANVMEALRDLLQSV